jgi:hypothetical protein
MSTAALARTALLAVLTSAAGCGLEFEAVPEVVANTCDGDEDCGDGTCATIDDRRMCVARQADLAGVIFQLEGTTTNGTTVSHVFATGASIQGERGDGWIQQQELDVPPPLALAGRFLRPGGVVDGCTEPDGSVPVKVEARPADELAGLSQVFTGASVIASGSHRFLLPVPAGRYDVYVVPQPIELPGCEVLAVAPPALYRDIEVKNDVLLGPEEETPRLLTGVVIPPPDHDLTGYVVELVDAERGLLLSERVTLGAAVDGEIPIGRDGADEDNEPDDLDGDGKADGAAYFVPSGSGLVLRISDPDGALVVHWDFDALDLDGDGEVRCELDDLISNAKQLEANVLDAQGRPVADASVTIKSVVLTGAASKNASFRVTATSGVDGKIHVELVPGTYQVLVAPPGESGPALLEGTWQVAPDALCCGTSFSLGSQSLITARVSTDAGEDAVGLAVRASPSLPKTRTYFESALESLVILPRQSAGSTDDSGLFAVPVDPGLYDVTLQPPAASGFPWLVLPSNVVVPAAQQPASTLEGVVVPFPAVFVGTASAQGIPAEGATVRAYLPLAGSETKDTAPVRVVQIGEAIVGAGGRFVLLVPPTVARAVADPSAASSSSVSSSAAGTFD